MCCWPRVAFDAWVAESAGIRIAIFGLKSRRTRMFENERLKPRILKPRAPRMMRIGVADGERISGSKPVTRTESRVTPRRARDKVRIGIGRPSIAAVLW